MIVYRELASLQADLGCSVASLYFMSNHLSWFYHRVVIPKSRGSSRTLCVPHPKLKAVQRRINDVILKELPVSSYATAYRRGISLVKGAAVHTGQDTVLKLDIRRFFASVRYTAVKREVFSADRFSEPIRILLSHLCYFEDVLPEGAPTSPTVSNILLYSFDEYIGAWCRERHIVYTRYCDDMTFSGSFDPQDVVPVVKEALSRYGFALHPHKTVVAHRHQRQTVTGIVVNDHTALPAPTRRALRQELYYCRRFGVTDHLSHIGSTLDKTTYLRQLLGRVTYALQLCDNRELRDARTWILQELHTV